MQHIKIFTRISAFQKYPFHPPFRACFKVKNCCERRQCLNQNYSNLQCKYSNETYLHNLQVFLSHTAWFPSNHSQISCRVRVCMRPVSFWKQDVSPHATGDLAWQVVFDQIFNTLLLGQLLRSRHESLTQHLFKKSCEFGDDWWSSFDATDTCSTLFLHGDRYEFGNCENADLAKIGMCAPRDPEKGVLT